MSRSNKKTLASVIIRVRHISDTQYDGKMYDNILAIFNQLTTVEKRVFLRGLVGILSVVDTKILERGEDPPEPPEITERTPEEIIEVLPVKRKSRLTMITTYLGTGVFVIILLSAMFGSFVITGENGILAKVENFISVIKQAF